VATRYYFRDTTVNQGTLSRLTASTAIPASGHTQPDISDQVRDLSTSAGSTPTRYTPAGAAQTAAQDGYLNRWASGSLSEGDFAGATTWTCGWDVAVESGATSTAYTMCSVYVVKSDNTVRGYIYDSHTLLGNAWDNLAVGGRGRVFSFDGSAVAGVLNTDKLVVEVWFHATQGSASAVSYRFEYNGTVVPTEGLDTTLNSASYIEFSPKTATLAWITA
jgi:hypothetical protein